MEIDAPSIVKRDQSRISDFNCFETKHWEKLRVPENIIEWLKNRIHGAVNSNDFDFANLDLLEADCKICWIIVSIFEILHSKFVISTVSNDQYISIIENIRTHANEICSNLMELLEILSFEIFDASLKIDENFKDYGLELNMDFIQMHSYVMDRLPHPLLQPMGSQLVILKTNHGEYDTSKLTHCVHKKSPSSLSLLSESGRNLCRKYFLCPYTLPYSITFAISRAYFALWSLVQDTPADNFQPDLFLIFDKIIKIAEKATSLLTGSQFAHGRVAAKLQFLLLSSVTGINCLILSSPRLLGQPSDSSTDLLLRISVLFRKLMNHSFENFRDLAIEVSITSLYFMDRFLSGHLDLWLSLFGDWSHLKPIICDAFITAFCSAVYLNLGQGVSPTGNLVVYDLALFIRAHLHECGANMLVRSLISYDRDTFQSSLLNRIVECDPTNRAMSLIWNCIHCMSVHIPIRDKLDERCLEHLADEYIKLYEQIIKKSLTNSVLSELADQIHDRLFEESQGIVPTNLLSFPFLCLRLFVVRIDRLGSNSLFRSALLRSVLIPNLMFVSSSLCVKTTIFEAFVELLQSFALLSTRLVDKESLDEANQVFLSINEHFKTQCFFKGFSMQTSDMFLLNRLISTFVECLTEPNRSLLPSVANTSTTGVQPIRKLFRSIAEFSLYLLQGCADALLHDKYYHLILSKVKEVGTEEDRNMMVGSISLWRKLGSLLVACSRPTTPVNGIAILCHQICWRSAELPSLRILSIKHLKLLTSFDVSQPEVFDIIFDLLSVQLELTSWCSETLSITQLVNAVEEIENDFFQRFLRLPSGALHRAPFLVNIIQRFLLRSVTGRCATQPNPDEEKVAEWRSPLISQSRSHLNRNVRLFVFALRILVRCVYESSNSSSVVDVEERKSTKHSLCLLLDQFTAEFHVMCQLPFLFHERQLITNDDVLQELLSKTSTDIINLLRINVDENRIADAFVDFLRAVWTGNRHKAPPLLQVSSLQAKKICSLTLTGNDRLQQRLLNLLLGWVTSADPLEPRYSVTWPQTYNRSHDWPDVGKNISSASSLPLSPTSSVTPYSPAFRGFAAYFASAASADVTCCSCGPLDNRLEIGDDAVKGSRCDTDEFNSDNFGLFWPSPLFRHLRGYSQPLDVQGLQRVDNHLSSDKLSLSRGKLTGFLLSTWFSLHAKPSNEVKPAESFSDLPLSDSRLLSLASSGSLLHLFTLEGSVTDASIGLNSKKSSSLCPSLAAGKRIALSCKSQIATGWVLQVWLAPRVCGIYVRVQRRVSLPQNCRSHSQNLRSRGGRDEPDASVVKLVGDSFLPNFTLGQKTGQAGDDYTPNWNHLLLSILWNTDLDDLLGGVVCTTVNGARYVERAFVMQPVAETGDQQFHACPNQALRRRSCISSFNAMTLWVGHEPMLVESENQQVGISVGNMLFCNGNLHGAEFAESESVVSRKPFLRDLALCIALCGPDWAGDRFCNDKDDFLCLKRKAQPIIRALMSRHQTPSPGSTAVEDFTDTASVFLSSRNIFSSSESKGKIVAPVFYRLLKNFSKHIFAVVLSHSPNQVIWFASDAFSVATGYNPRVHTLSYAMLHANRPEFRWSNEKAANFGKQHYMQPAVSHFRAIDRVTSVQTLLTDDNFILIFHKRNVEDVLVPLGGIRVVFFILGVVTQKEACSSEIHSLGFELLLALKRHSCVVAEQFSRPLPGVCEEANNGTLENTKKRNYNLLTSYGSHILSSVLSQLARQRTIKQELAKCFIRHIFFECRHHEKQFDDEFAFEHRCVIDCDLLHSLVVFATSLQVCPSSDGPKLPLISILLKATVESLSEMPSILALRYPNVLTLKKELLLANVRVLETMQTLSSTIMSFRMNFSNLSQDSFVEILDALCKLISRHLSLCRLNDTHDESVISFLLRAFVTVDPDLYHSAATRAFVSDNREFFSSTTNSNLESSTASCGDIMGLTEQLVESIRKKLPSRRHSAPPVNVPVTSNSNSAEFSADSVAPHIVVCSSSNSSDASPPLSVHLGPVSSSRNTTPWLNLQPSISLKGASRAEAVAIERFIAELKPPPSNKNVLFHEKGRAGLLHLSASNVFFGSCTSLYLRNDTSEAVDVDDENVLFVEAHKFSRWQSLPSLSLSAEHSDTHYNMELDATLIKPASDGPTERELLTRKHVSLSSRPETLAARMQINEPDTNIITHLRQNRFLASGLLGCLETFWAGVTKSAVASLPVNDSFLPPIWLIYHLAGHPSLHFRSSAIKLLDLWCNVTKIKKRVQASVAFSLYSQFLCPSTDISVISINSTEEPGPYENFDLLEREIKILPVSTQTVSNDRLLDNSFESRFISTLRQSCLVSPGLVAGAFRLITPKDVELSTLNLEIRLPVVFAIVVASTIDVAALLRIVSELSFAGVKFLQVVACHREVFYQALLDFTSLLKERADLCDSLGKHCLCGRVFDLVHLCDSICYCLRRLPGTTDEIVMLHEVGGQLARLCASLMSAAYCHLDIRDCLGLLNRLVSPLNCEHVCGSSCQDSSACLTRETVLRCYLSLIGNLNSAINDDTLDKKSWNIYGHNTVLQHLSWTVSAVVQVLPQNVFQSNEGDHHVSILRHLERALLTLLVNFASQSLRRNMADVFRILSSALFDLLNQITSISIEKRSVCVAGEYLLYLLSAEPQLLSGSTSPNLIKLFMELRKNLKALTNLMQPPLSDVCENQVGSDDALLKCQNGPMLNFVRMTLSIDAIYNWMGREIPFLSSPVHQIDGFTSYPAFIPIPGASCPDPISSSSGPHYWFERLHKCFERGQRKWLIVVSQARGILTVLAPFHWTKLAETLGHHGSVFANIAQSPTFSRLDAFESESRERRRRRPTVFWVDNRFLRPSSQTSLGQNAPSHPLAALLIPDTLSFSGSASSQPACHLYRGLPHSRSPPTCQGLFEPSAATFSSGRKYCLGVWSCFLITASTSTPPSGELILDRLWLHLCLNLSSGEHQGPSLAPHNETLPFVRGLHEESAQTEVFICPLNEIVNVEERRFELRDVAAELFFRSSSGVAPILVSLRSKQDRDSFFLALADACSRLAADIRHTDKGYGDHSCSSLPWWLHLTSGRLESTHRHHHYLQPPQHRQQLSLRGICDRLVAPFPTPVGSLMRCRLIDAQVAWLRGEMSNFDYIMVLNTVAGRTYNDLTQYPIFPWIISDYRSEVLDLTKIASFRRLDRPISVQTDARAELVQSHYEEMQANQESMTDSEEQLICPVFHYPSFCSNEAISLHFLFRLAPFAFRLIQFQDGNFDAPDRAFHSVAKEWQLATSSVACAKELIPEFFFRPDIFVNWEHFELGALQNGASIDSVVLPPWAKGDPRLFTLVNKAALESDFVTVNLPSWIDLIFGYKQTGRNAEKALNLYNPYTYFGAIDVDAIGDPLRRSAVLGMIRNYGQVPRQLFPNHPHPRRSLEGHGLRADQFSGLPAEFFGLAWLIRLVLSSISSSAALSVSPSCEVNPLSAVGIICSASRGHFVDGVAQRGSKGCPSVVPLTAGAPLDTVVGLSWGSWAGSPAVNELRLIWYVNLHKHFKLPSTVTQSKQLSCLFHALGAYWISPSSSNWHDRSQQNVAPPHRTSVYSREQPRTLMRNKSIGSGISTFWLPLITEMDTYLFLLECPGDRRNIASTLLVKFQLQIAFKLVNIRVSSRHFSGPPSSFANASFRLPLPQHINVSNRMVTSFLVSGKPSRLSVPFSKTFNVLIGLSDGGVFSRRMCRTELLCRLSGQLDFGNSPKRFSDTSPVKGRAKTCMKTASSSQDADVTLSGLSKKFAGVSFSVSSSPDSSDSVLSTDQRWISIGRKTLHRRSEAYYKYASSSDLTIINNNYDWTCLIGHIGHAVGCLAVCPSHGLIATADCAGSVLLWDLASHTFLYRLNINVIGHDFSISYLRSFSPGSNSGQTFRESEEIGADEDLTEEHDQKFARVCGLEFNQYSGDLLVVRSNHSDYHEILLVLFTADGRQSCSRVLDFSAELGVYTVMQDTSTDAGSVESIMSECTHRIPILFSSSSVSGAVDCILVGGIDGCLVWLNSWTLDTVSVMQLPQPSSCAIVSLVFAPLSSANRQAPLSSSTTVHPINTLSPLGCADLCRALYVIDLQGWLYFLEPCFSQASSDRSCDIKASNRDCFERIRYNIPGLWSNSCESCDLPVYN